MQKWLMFLRKYNFFLAILFLALAEISHCFEIKGNYIQGGLLFGKTEIGAKVYFDNISIPIDKKGNFLIGLKRKQAKVSNIKILLESGEQLSKKIIIDKRKYKIQKINNINKNKVTPPERFFKRIKNESNLINKAKKKYIEEPFYIKGFIMPAQGIITGVYGSQRILNGIPKRPHYGLDIANQEGTDVISVSDGIIVLAEEDLYFSGGAIIISHGQGLTSSYLHLSKITTKVGEQVYQGQKLGEIGSTGRSTGPHLDWRMEVHGVRIDPKLLLD